MGEAVGGPDPRRVAGLAGLARELDLLRARAAAGTLRAKVSIEDLARQVRLPRSTLHRYVTGRTVVPSAVLDRIVIALGAGPAEQRQWNEAWFRVHHGPISAVPCGLPAPVRGFVGRAAELARLDDIARAGKGLAAVTGGPGVGKTALVVHWAHRARDLFPDGSLFVDLCGYGPERRTVRPAEAVAALLGCLAPGDELPAEPAARIARYRSVLAGRTMLVVLDNAVGAEQVRSLLPGAGAGMVVVTGRDDLTGLVVRDGADRVDVDVLPLADALALLGGRDDATVLAERCGRLPLALRVAALPGADVDGGLGWLETGDPRTDVRTVFSWSYDVLAEHDPEAAAVFRALGRFGDQEFELVAVAALVRMTVERARRVLAALVRANLVQAAPYGRYRLPHLLGAYAAELSAGVESVTA